MANFESQMEDLEKILQSLQKDGLKLSEISKHVKQAKKLYESCMAQLDSAKMEIEDVSLDEEDK